MMDRSKITEALSTGWEFKQTDAEEDWLPVRRVPTVVHLDLLDNQKIADPHIDRNEIDVQWVGERSWTYRVTLPESNPRDGFTTELVFDGLDTFATVKLNGSVVLKSDNMFIPHRVDVTELRKESSNYSTHHPSSPAGSSTRATADSSPAAGGVSHLASPEPGFVFRRPLESRHDLLEIEFDSASSRAVDLQKAYPEHKYLCWNGHASRLTTRKAQYHWGWDWGPVLMTAGPWRPVRLETFRSRIEDFWIEYDVVLGANNVQGTVHIRVTPNTVGEVQISVEPESNASTNDSESNILISDSVAIQADGTAEMPFHIHQADLWFPHGYGKQTLYRISALLTAERGSILDRQYKKIGFRHAELVQKDDNWGKTFFFRINGIDVFCGGSNWIPADNFIPRITQEKYRKRLQTMVDGNQIMTRIWGGGIWEEDIFYDLCDELGILVWQDFMFACGNYPAWPEFLKSVKDEASAQLQRLRHHCSIVVYAGNNEDYQLMETEGLTYKYEDKVPENWLQTDFPARYIYEKLLPDIVQKYHPSVAYQPGSPWSDGRATTDKNIGDLHQWNVWHGTQEKYQLLSSMGGRFNSEFGMQGFPNIDTINSFCTHADQLYPQSQIMDFHNKAAGFERRIATYLFENVRLQSSLESHIYLTQLVQSEALSLAYKGWRRRYGEDRYCGGALVWQLNDCWPGISWSIVDYFQRKKPVYYTISRVLASIAVGVEREYHDWSASHGVPANEFRIGIWIASSELIHKSATVIVDMIPINGEPSEVLLNQEVDILPNGTTPIASLTIKDVRGNSGVFAARVLVDGVVVARDVDWPQPLKYLSFPDRGVKVRYSEDQDRIFITAQRPTKGLVFEEREGVLLSDNALDVVPGDEIEVRVTGLRAGDRPLAWRYLGQDV